MFVHRHKEIYPRLLICWLLALFIRYVHPQYCKEVYEEFIHCNSSTDFQIACPESHMIDINVAYPMQLPHTLECANDVLLEKQSCRLESLGYYFSTLCSGQRTCLILADIWNRLEKTSCRDLYGGSKMLYMRYRCTLGTTSVSVLPLCNVDITATSYVRLVSSAYSDMVPSNAPAPYPDTFYSSPCTCRLTLPGDTEMQISRTNFWKSSRRYNCDQRVIVETLAGEIVAAFCSSQKIHQFLACDPNWRDYRIRFQTKDPRINVSFSIDFSVFHEVGFTFECGVNLRTPQPPLNSSATSTTATTTITTTSEPTTTAITTTETTTLEMRTPSTTISSTTEILTTPTAPTSSTTKKSKPVPPKVYPTSDTISSSESSVSPALLDEVQSTTAKLEIGSIEGNDVNGLIEPSDVRIDNTRGVKQGGDDGKDVDARETGRNLLLPIEAIIGIAVGSVMLLIFLVIMASCFARNKKDRSDTTEQVNLDLSIKEEPIYEEPKYYATSYDNPDLYPQGKKSRKLIAPGLPPRNSNLYAEPPSSTSSGSMRRSRLDDFRSRSMDFSSIGTVSSAPYLSAKKISPPSHPHVNLAFSPDPPLPTRMMSPQPLRIWPSPPLHQTSTLPTERHFEMAPMSPQARGTRTTPTPRKDRGKSSGPKTKPKPTQLPTKRSASSDQHMRTASPPRHYKHHIEPGAAFSATAPDRAKHHDKKRRYRRQQSASPPRVHFHDDLRSRRLPDLLTHGRELVQNPLFGRDSHDMFFAY